MKEGEGKTEEEGEREKETGKEGRQGPKRAGAFTALSPVGSTMSGTQ